MIESKFIQRIAQDLLIEPGRVTKAIGLLDEGATIPFIARYRKDVTGNLDEEKLETIENGNAYFTSLTERRTSILEAIAKQGKLTDELRGRIEACFDKTTLEDLYLPYKKKKRTKATVAREKGLTPLADFIWGQEPGEQTIEEFAATFVKPEKALGSVEEALEGARHILAERLSAELEVRTTTRERMMKEGKIAAHPTKNAEGKKTKFETYYEFSEPVKKIPSHRFLAILRGVNDGFLRMELVLDDTKLVEKLVARVLKDPGSAFEPLIKTVVQDSYDRLLRPSLENEVTGVVRGRADEEAVHVFRANAENLFLSSPAGQISVIGVDPGLRSGCKLAVVDGHGNYVESATVFPTPPQNDLEGAEKVLLALMAKHGVHAIAIGNGTGSREAAGFVKQALSKIEDKGAFLVFVNEAGASVNSASKRAREEFPELDVTVRGAISIARRLQDPLAELVKIEPRHVGVGQYQHDVNQKMLREGLHQTVVSCVNKVGVELNTASVDLLRYVSGLKKATAENIVKFRKDAGGFKTRQELLDVDGIGPKAFEQAAGLLRIVGAQNVLDRTGIHPEAYPVVEQMAESLSTSVAELLENREAVAALDLGKFESDTIGTLTLRDVAGELMKPGRDPRKEFRVPRFLEGVNSVSDLEEGMEMEGVVTNVTDFGAFVDVGVHQDGLVHLSELANRFVNDPRQVAKVGDIVKVKVIKVDKELPRISLSMKALQPVPKPGPKRARSSKRRKGGPERGARGDDARKPAEQRETDRKPEARRERRKEDSRPPRREKRKDSRRNDGRGKKPDGRKQAFERGSREPLNTQLADQLAALRDKLGS